MRPKKKKGMKMTKMALIKITTRSGVAGRDGRTVYYKGPANKVDDFFVSRKLRRDHNDQSEYIQVHSFEDSGSLWACRRPKEYTLKSGTTKTSRVQHMEILGLI